MVTKKPVHRIFEHCCALCETRPKVPRSYMDPSLRFGITEKG